MANGKFSNGKRSNLKPVALLLAIALLVGTAVGGTLAWLTDNSGPKVNTFTVGNIDIELNESPNLDLKMIPGHVITKDPKVTVNPGSEDCWLFVKIEETGAYFKPEGESMPVAYAVRDFLDYEVITEKTSTNLIDDTYWMEVPGELGVYACKVKAVDENAEAVTFPVIWYDANKDNVMQDGEINKVGVQPTVTKEMMDNISKEGATKPVLTFTAYAVQYYKTNGTPFEAAEAWATANSAANS